jgi:hypothetical protein
LPSRRQKKRKQKNLIKEKQKKMGKQAKVVVLFIVIALSIVAIVLARRNTFPDTNRMDCDARNSPGGDCVAVWGDDRICYKAVQNGNYCNSNYSYWPMGVAIGAGVMFIVFLIMCCASYKLPENDV